MRLDKDTSLPHNTPLLRHTGAQNSKQKIRMYKLPDEPEQSKEEEVHM
jgi:hypothetical protein